jgi:hypothetical protein
MMQDATAQRILERLSDLENYLDQALVPYEEFSAGRSTTTPLVDFFTVKIPGPRR